MPGRMPVLDLFLSGFFYCDFFNRRVTESLTVKGGLRRMGMEKTQSIPDFLIFGDKL